MKVYESGTKCDAVDVVINNNTVNAVTDINVLTLEEDEDGNGWYLKQEDGRYLYSSAAKNLKADDENKTLCTITNDFQINMGTTSGILQYNASSPRFALIQVLKQLLIYT